MTVLIALVAGLAGVGVMTWGVRTWFRARFRNADALGRRRGRRVFALGAGVGIVGPVVAAATDWPTDGGDAVLVSVLLLGWSGLITTAAGLGGVLMLVAGHRVSSAARRSAERAVQRVPSPRLLTGRPAATNSLPRDWADLIEVDRSLGRRLLSYADIDAAAAHPVMADPSDPVTRAAVDAMLRCDELRTPAVPQPWRDVRASEYARAVADFRVALDAAEANSQRANHARLTHTENATLDKALRELAYLREHATTPSERRDVYDRLVTELGTLGVDETPAARSHPWLDVEQRAR